MESDYRYIFNSLYGNSALADNLYKIAKDVELAVREPDNAPRLRDYAEAAEQTIPSAVPEDGLQPSSCLRTMLLRFCSRSPNWLSTNLHYNVGAPTNAAAAQASAYCQSQNIFGINDGLAGRALDAEKASTHLVAEMAGAQNAVGWFTFGGTATNLYGLKIGIRKTTPSSGRCGVGNDVVAMSTTESHFGHYVAADWLGIGSEQVWPVDSHPNGTTNIDALSERLEEAVAKGKRVACIFLNGGTSYSHVIDDIAAAVAARDRLVERHNLTYQPHVHVDSVIGWFWLFFAGYEFDENPLQIDPEVLEALSEQYQKISMVRLADSWGVDFHKGIGGCPVPTSLFVLNRPGDAELLSKKHDHSVAMHQIAEEFSSVSPVNYTLENSRPVAPMVAAVVAMLTLGRNGHRRYLAALVSSAMALRELLEEDPRILVCDTYRLGFVVMVRLYPPSIPEAQVGRDIKNDNVQLHKINQYNKLFFSWYLDSGHQSRIEISFSTSFKVVDGTGICALKIYLMSPYLSPTDVQRCASMVRGAKQEYDLLHFSGSSRGV